MIAQWKAEARAEAEATRKGQQTNQWRQRLARYLDSEYGDFMRRLYKILTHMEVFVCNLPLSIGAIAMAICDLGVVWFKFAGECTSLVALKRVWIVCFAADISAFCSINSLEENLDSCEPVHFHSSQCSFPEFPGCFYCDTTNSMYKLTVNFHFVCSAIAGVLVLFYILKIFLAAQVVMDELSSPTTASPAGLLCMTAACV